MELSIRRFGRGCETRLLDGIDDLGRFDSTRCVIDRRFTVGQIDVDLLNPWDPL